MLFLAYKKMDRTVDTGTGVVAAVKSCCVVGVHPYYVLAFLQHPVKTDIELGISVGISADEDVIEEHLGVLVYSFEPEYHVLG